MNQDDDDDYDELALTKCRVRSLDQGRFTYNNFKIYLFIKNSKALL